MGNVGGGDGWEMKVAQMLFSPLSSLLTDRQTKGKAQWALLRGWSP